MSIQDERRSHVSHRELVINIENFTRALRLGRLPSWHTARRPCSRVFNSSWDWLLILQMLRRCALVASMQC